MPRVWYTTCLKEKVNPNNIVFNFHEEDIKLSIKELKRINLGKSAVYDKTSRHLLKNCVKEIA